MNTENIYTQFMDYARKRDYYASQLQNIHSDTILGVAQNTNAYCHDNMELMAVLSPENKLLLLHSGSYCALAHASAELLCESYENLSLDNFLYTVHYINNKCDNDVSTSLSCDMNNYLQMAISILDKKMSATRNNCFMLSWKSVLQLVDIIKKYIKEG